MLLAVFQEPVLSHPPDRREVRASKASRQIDGASSTLRPGGCQALPIDGNVPPSVLQAARRLRLTDPDEAFGRCLAMSLELLRVAEAFEMQADLIGWRVRGDAFFSDHWAVAISAMEVLDLTHVQVDGSTALFHRVEDYPHNFTHPRRFPGAALTGMLRSWPLEQGEQFDERFAWNLRRRLFRYEWCRALKLRRPRSAGQALGSLAMYALAHVRQRWHAALQARKVALERRLRAGR